MATWVGIDVSMETVDIAWLEGKEKCHVKIANDPKRLRGYSPQGYRRLALCDGSMDACVLNLALGTAVGAMILRAHQIPH